METNFLKNTGRVVISLLLIFFCSSLYAIEIETELSPSKISVGESASLKIKITGKSSNVTPVKIPTIDGLDISFAGSSRSFQFVNGKTWSGAVLSFSIYGEKKGEYKIPSFTFEADGENIKSREVTLTVGGSSSGKNSSLSQLRGDVELSSETVFSGEPFFMRYYIYGSNGDSLQIKGFIEQPHAKGFVIKDLSEKFDDSGKIYAGTFCLVPVDKGVYDIGAGSVEALAEITQGLFSMNKRMKIAFPSRKIKVIPIPAKGKPDKFTGDVGEFKLEAQVPSGKFKLFEEIKIPVRISGRGNLLTLSKPQIENTEEIKTVIEEKEQTLSVAGTGLSGEKNFLITVIPQKEGTINPGRVFIEYFNPYKKSYEKAESIPLSFEVLKGENGSNKTEVQFSPEGSSTGKFNYLYVVLILSGLAVSVIVLVMWERKKFRMIREELRTDIPADDLTPAVNRNQDILKNIQISVNDNNNEVFLLNADRGINQIDPVKLSAEELVKYNFFKEKIYFCRYGGGVFVRTEMKDLSDWLKKNLK